MNTREMYEYHKKHIDGIADQYRLKEYTEQIIASIDELMSGNVSINGASLEIISACALISDNLLWDTDKIDDYNFDIIIKKIENYEHNTTKTD